MKNSNTYTYTKRHHSVRLLCAVCSIAGFSSAFAEDNLSTAASMEIVEVVGNKELGLNLNAVNSASNRLGLSAMDFPGSVEFISKEDISIRGDYTSLSAITRATGFSASASPGNGGTATSVRGFNGHSSVAYTYDGVRLYVGAGTVTFPADTWTVERVDILRGAGSVINGIGAIGATVNYVTKQPKFEDISSEVEVAVGSEDMVRIAFGSGGQLTDTTAYRVDLVNHESDGYVDNGDERRSAIAASLLHKPMDNLDIQFSIDYAETDQSAYWGTPLVNNKIISSTRDENYNIDDGLVEYEDLWPRVSIEWQIADGVRFRNDTFYMKADRHWRNVESYDYSSATGEVDRSFFLEILHEQRQWGSRSDVLFDLDTAGLHSHLNVGAEFNMIDFTHRNNRPYSGSDSVNLFTPNGGHWADGVESVTSKDFESETFQYAVFADYMLEFNDQLSLIAGVRYDDIDFEREDFERSNAVGHFEAAEKSDADFSGTSWRIGAVYQPTTSFSLYAQYSEALDSIQSILSATKTDLDLGEGTQIEIGLKHSLWDGKAQYTIALFDIEKDNLLSDNPGGIQEQIGQQSSRGIEIDLALQLHETLSLDANLALVDAEYDEFVSGDDYSGNRPRNIPRKTSNLWLNWTPVSHVLVDAGVRYVGERYSNNSNTAELPSYTTFDMGIRWQLDNALSISLRGKNLTDEEDFVLAPYGNQWVLGQGRNYQLGVNYQF